LLIADEFVHSAQTEVSMPVGVEQHHIGLHPGDAIRREFDDLDVRKGCEHRRHTSDNEFVVIDDRDSNKARTPGRY